jgi:type IV pilus assembly protein PilM
MASRTAIGIVVDCGTVQVVELAADGPRLQVRRAACEPIPPKVFSDGELVDADAVAEIIRRIFRTHRLPRRNVCVAFGGRLAIARVIEVTETNAAEAERMLQDRIARYAIYENLEVFWKAAPVEVELENKRSYLAAAVAKDQVCKLLPALRRAGIHVSHVEPYALAAMRSLAATMGEDERPVVLMVLRSESTDLLIAKGRQPLLFRSVEQGVRNLAQRPETIEDLLVEARRAVEFCQIRFANDRPRLWLCLGADGGGQDLAAVLASFAKGLQAADVEAVPALSSLVWGPHAAGGEVRPWAAVGAAMVSLGRNETIAHLNLVPAEWPEVERVEKQLMGVVASICLAVVATVAATVGLRLMAGDAAKHAEAASVQMKANTTDVQMASELTRQAAEGVERVKLWKEVRNQIRPFDWAAGIHAVMEQIPDGIRVGEVQYRAGVLRLTGETQTMDLVHQLVQRMGRLPCLDEANIERLVQSSPDRHAPCFTIKCHFRNTPPESAEEKKSDP